MYLQRLYIGLNDKDQHEQIISTEASKEVIKDILSDRYVSYTIIECEGIFLTEVERSIIIEYTYTGQELLIDDMHINAIKSALNQAYILQTIQEIELKFV